MILMVRTPEDIFRAEKKDIYVVQSLEDPDGEAPGLSMIKEWIRTELPETGIELLGPSEHSGIIEGGIGRALRVDFSNEGLTAFSRKWEKNELSVDPRFQCYRYSYDRWFRVHGRFQPSPERPTGFGPIIWWFTSIGFVSHQFSECELGQDFPAVHPANHKDIWNNAVLSLQTLSSLNPGAFTHGHVCSDPQGRPYRCVFAPPPQARSRENKYVPSLAEIRSWFSMPDDVPIEEDFF